MIETEEGKKDLSGLVIGNSSREKIKWFVSPFSLVQPDSGCMSEFFPQLHGDDDGRAGSGSDCNNPNYLNHNHNHNHTSKKKYVKAAGPFNSVSYLSGDGDPVLLPPPQVLNGNSSSKRSNKKNGFPKGDCGSSSQFNSQLKRYQSPVRRASPAPQSALEANNSSNAVGTSSKRNRPADDGYFCCEGVSIELKRICGSGSYATVYEGWSSELGKRFAVKVIRLSECRDNGDEELGDMETIASIVYREVELHRQAMKGISSSSSNNTNAGSVIQLYGFSQVRVASVEDFEEDHLFLIMEFTSLPDLFDLTIQNNGMGCARTKVIMQQLISALEQCHGNGVYHRDIKPENVLFVEEDFTGCSYSSFPIETSSGRRRRLRRQRATAAAAASSDVTGFYHGLLNHRPADDDSNESGKDFSSSGDDEEHTKFRNSSNSISSDKSAKKWNSNWVVRLSDFGLATEDKICRDRAVGSLPYMSPEAYCNQRGNGYSSEAADVWSLGVIFFSIRFAKTLWTVPHAEEDSNYAAFNSDPMSIKRAFNLSNLAYNMVIRMLDPCPQTRCSLSEVKSLLSRINKFVDEEDNVVVGGGGGGESEVCKVAEREEEERSVAVVEDDAIFEEVQEEEKQYQHIAHTNNNINSSSPFTDEKTVVGVYGIVGGRNQSSSLLINLQGDHPHSVSVPTGHHKSIDNNSNNIHLLDFFHDDQLEENFSLDALCHRATRNLLISGKRPNSSASDSLARSRKDSGLSKSYASSWGDLDEEKMDFTVPLDF